MNARCAAVLTAVAGLVSAAPAQIITTPGITASLDLTWQEDPAYPHNNNGVLEPGEHALVLMTASFTGQWTEVTLSPPSVWQSTQIAGFWATRVDVLALSSDASGVFNDGVTNPASSSVGPNANAAGTSGYGVRMPFRIGGNYANGQPSPSGFVGISPEQYPMDPSGLLSANPVENLDRLGWAPASYAPRTVMFSVAPSPGSGEYPVDLALYFDWGSGLGFGRLPSTSVTFGAIGIPVVPAPASIGVLLAAASSRRRRSLKRTAGCILAPCSPRSTTSSSTAPASPRT